MSGTPSRRPRIAWLPGDGIGPEVLDGARLVLEAVEFDAQILPADIGWECWKRDGDALPRTTLELLQTCDAALFGAITSRPPHEAQEDLATSLRGRGLHYASPIVRLRQELDLFTKIVRARAYDGNPNNHRKGIDLVVVRENTEGLYAGVELRGLSDELRSALRNASAAMRRFDEVASEDLALGCRIITRRGANRIARAAFELARRERRDSVTIVEKPNVLRETSWLMIEEARAVAREFPDIRLDEANVDAIVMSLVKDPLRFGVLVASNLFGDILSDLCAQLAGGIGLTGTANEGPQHAIFEPLHGSAPKYAGRNIVNPVGAIVSAAMMLERLGDGTRAARIHRAVEDVIRTGAARTRDLGGSAGTREMAEAIAARAARPALP